MIYSTHVCIFIDAPTTIFHSHPKNKEVYRKMFFKCCKINQFLLKQLHKYNKLSMRIECKSSHLILQSLQQPILRINDINVLKGVITKLVRRGNMCEYENVSLDQVKNVRIEYRRMKNGCLQTATSKIYCSSNMTITKLGNLFPLKLHTEQYDSFLQHIDIII